MRTRQTTRAHPTGRLRVFVKVQLPYPPRCTVSAYYQHDQPAKVLHNGD